jgi:hypothetical protein
MRKRRVANEKRFLDLLAAANPGGLAVDGWEQRDGGDMVRVTLLDTPAYLREGGVVRRHELLLVLPEYFPSTPIEAYLERPVAHPNVHPVNGFVCLWASHAPGDTVVEALLQTQRVITWQLSNPNPEHRMQPEWEALAPLPYSPLTPPAEHVAGRLPAAPLGRRKRLDPLEP